MARADIIMESQITRVVLYQKGCQVTRTGVVTLKKGISSVVIKELPSQLDKNSIRVEGRGPGVILNTIVKKAYSRQERSTEYQALVDEVSKVEQQLEGLSELEYKRTYLAQFKLSLEENTGKFPLFSATGKEAFDRYNDLDDVLTGKIFGLVEEISSLNKEKEDLEKRLATLRNKIDDLGAREGVVEYTEIVLAVDAEAGSEFELDVNYVYRSSSYATWEPFYEMFIKEGSPDTILKMNALVSNKTGEEWVGISLVLSTANIQPVHIHEPEPYFLRVYRPEPVKAKKKMLAARGGMVRRMAKKEKVMEDYEMEEEEPFEPAPVPAPEPEMEFTGVDVSESIGIQMYELTTKVDIPNGRTSGPFFLQDLELTSRVEYYWTALQGELVVARNIVKNDKTLIIPGKIRTYIDDDFVGLSHQPLVAPFDEFKVGLREGKNVKVKKKLVDRSRKTGAVVKGKIKRDYKYEITIEVLNPVDGKLILKDTIPHSDSERIKVEAVEFSVPPVTNKIGVVDWEMDTSEKMKKSIMYSFSVRYPKNMVISPPLP
ncbi:MAG: mucoidy inhibitor MuiA family protein [Promethearchaeota archaeon]